MPRFTLHKEERNAKVLGREGEHFVLSYWLSLRSAAIQSCLQMNGVQWFMWNKSSLSVVRSTKPISHVAKRQHEEKKIQKPVPEQTRLARSLAGSPCPEQHWQDGEEELRIRCFSWDYSVNQEISISQAVSILLFRSRRPLKNESLISDEWELISIDLRKSFASAQSEWKTLSYLVEFHTHLSQFWKKSGGKKYTTTTSQSQYADQYESWPNLGEALQNRLSSTSIRW